MELTPTLILNLALLIVPPVAIVLVFRQWLARHIRWTVALTALCDVLLFWDELFYYESFGLFAVLILVQLAATGAAAFRMAAHRFAREVLAFQRLHFVAVGIGSFDRLLIQRLLPKALALADFSPVGTLRQRDILCFSGLGGVCGWHTLALFL